MKKNNIIQTLESAKQKITSSEMSQIEENDNENFFDNLFEPIFEILTKTLFINKEDIKLHEFKEKLIKKEDISHIVNELNTVIDHYLNIVKTSKTDNYFPSIKLEHLKDLLFIDSEINYKNLSIYVEDLINRLSLILDQSTNTSVYFFDEYREPYTYEEIHSALIDKNGYPHVLLWREYFYFLNEIETFYNLIKGHLESVDHFSILTLSIDQSHSFEYNFTHVSKNIEKLLFNLKSEIKTKITKYNLNFEFTIQSWLETLENVLKNLIYNFILTNPTAYHKDSSSITVQRKKAIKKRDRYTCQLCNKKFKEKELEVDHIFPHSLGGSDEEINLMTACSICNNEKSASLKYYKSDEGRFKLYDNITNFLRDLTIINDFSKWLKEVGDKRRKSI